MSNRPAYTLAQMSFSVACLYAICGHCGHFGVISLEVIRKIGPQESVATAEARLRCGRCHTRKQNYPGSDPRWANAFVRSAAMRRGDRRRVRGRTSLSSLSWADVARPRHLWCKSFAPLSLKTPEKQRKAERSKGTD